MITMSHVTHQGHTQGGPDPQWLHESTVNNIIVSGEATLSAEDSGQPLGGRGSAPNTAGELTALPLTL